jgi:ABC-type ATPase with predicted acetyltransferase domain
MYIYNVTINVDPSIHSAWLEWMNQTHIPEMLGTVKFSEARICRVLVEEETGGYTYAVQYSTPSRKMLEAYYREDASRMRQDGFDRFGEAFVAFRTELEIISEHG